MSQSAKELLTRLEAVIDTAIDGIITINKMGVIESINRAGALMFGYEKDELLGQKVNVLMTRHDSHHHDQYIDNYLTTRKPKIIGIGREVMCKKKSGAEFPGRLAVSEVLLNDRIIFTGIIHDLSAVKAAQDEVERLNAELEELVQIRTNELEEVVNKLLRTNQELEEREKQLNTALMRERELGELKSRFVSMASHEFRTPLSTILSSASLISKYNKPEHGPNREKHLGKIKRSVDNLTGVLNDFLSLSKLEEGKVVTEESEVDLRQLCKDIIEDLDGIIKSDQKIWVNAKVDSTIKTDKRTIRNVLFNLISNAIKYSPDDGTIECNLDKTRKHMIITIKDDGIGIPEEEQKYIFTRFFRATNVENIQGTGLGLTIVKRYLDLLGGEITFESASDMGSTFRIKLPINE